MRTSPFYEIALRDPRLVPGGTDDPSSTPIFNIMPKIHCWALHTQHHWRWVRLLVAELGEVVSETHSNIFALSC